MDTIRQNSGRMVQLDGLRALAVLGVLVSHTWQRAQALDLGPSGVNLFFVLSGFLITGILLQARDQAQQANCSPLKVLRAFYARRFLRIFPPCYLALAVGLILGLPQVRQTLFWDVTYLSNWYMFFHSGLPGRPVAHLWTLAIEEQFYLLLPAVALFAPRRHLPILFGVSILASPVFRILLAGMPHHYDSWEKAVRPTFSNFDTLGMGALLACLRQTGGAGSRWLTAHRRSWFWLGLLTLAAVDVLAKMDRGWPVRLVLYGLASGCLFAWVVDVAATGFTGALGAFLSARPVRYLGVISYGVYVYHEFVQSALDSVSASGPVGRWIPADGPIRLAIVTIITIAVSAVSWRLMEQPLNELKRYFPYVPRPAAAAREMSSVRHAPAGAAEPVLSEVRT